MSRHIAIIGNGVAGITAARFIRRTCEDRITVISDESDHFFSRTALMYVYMGHLTFQDTKPYEDWFWEKNRIDLLRARVTAVDLSDKRLTLEDGESISYDVLIIATGSRPNQFGWPGQDLAGVQGLYSLQDLERMERETAGIHRAVVVGGGLIGIEMTEMLHSRRIPVTFLVREASYMEYVLPADESRMVNREIVSHGVDLRLSTELSAIHGDAEHVAGIETNTGERIGCQFVGLTVGVHPNIDFLRDSGIETGRGILVNQFFETSAADVYAVGDCAEFRDPRIAHRPVEQLWYTARRHGKTVARSVCGERTPYSKGVFFNSAKFFDLEYQTYGDVRARLPDGEATWLRLNEDERWLVRINYKEGSRAVVGFNVMGLRLRHEVCEQWIRAGNTVEEVVSRLDEARFDPEFSSKVVV